MSAKAFKILISCLLSLRARDEQTKKELEKILPKNTGMNSTEFLFYSEEQSASRFLLGAPNVLLKNIARKLVLEKVGNIIFKNQLLLFSIMKRSSRRWKKKRQMRWKWQRKRLKKEKRKRKLKRARSK